MNLATIIVALIIAGVIFLAVRSIYKGKKEGKACSGCSGCGGGCSHCETTGEVDQK